MITLNFTLEQVNGLLQMLGNLPFAQVNGMIQEIVSQGQPQADAMEKAAQAEAADVAEKLVAEMTAQNAAE